MLIMNITFEVISPFSVKILMFFLLHKFYFQSIFYFAYLTINPNKLHSVSIRM